MKVCDKTCIFFFFPIINKYFLMAKRSLLSRCPSYMTYLRAVFSEQVSVVVMLLDLYSGGVWFNFWLTYGLSLQFFFVFCCFCQSLHVNAGIVPWLGHGHFLPNL